MNAVATFQPPRLPYHPGINDRFGIDASGWKALVEAVYPLAKSPDSVAMALSYCKARKLDPFKKPVHIVPMWDSKIGGYVETIWPGISEVRTTAFRTGQYAGCDEAEFGPMTSKTFTGKVKRKEGWIEQTVEVEFPEWCRMTVYRVLGERVCKFVGPKVKWLESYATIGNTDLPNDMWQSRPEGQIEKCAEAAALRKSFPEELGNQLTAEEMEGRRVEGDLGHAETAAPKRQPPAAPQVIEDAEVVDVEQTKPVEQKQEAKPAAKAGPKAAPKVEQQQDQPAADEYDPAPILAKIKALFDGARDDDHLEEIRSKQALPLYERLKRSDQEAAILLYQEASARVAPADAETAQDDQQQDENAGEGEAIKAAGGAEDDTFPGDLPSKASGGAAKAPTDMTPAEYEVYAKGYIAEATDGAALKKLWFGEAEVREAIGVEDSVRKALRALFTDKANALRDAEG